MASRPAISSFHFPPGVRFHPSDQELIVYYLFNKVNSHPLPACIITDVKFYNYNPWDLPKLAIFGEDEWFFFSPRDRKYPNGVRPNRTTASGYWKATGSDRPILSPDGSKIGVKKALVFYVGKAPSGLKTDWNMMEYRLPDTSIKPSRPKGSSMRLDDWVLCRVRQKGNMSKNAWEAQPSPQELLSYLPNNEKLPSVNDDPLRDINTNYLLTKDNSLIYSMFLQGLIPLENILRAASQFSSDGKYYTGYEHESGKVNIQVTNSSLQSFCGSSKRKHDDGTKYQNPHDLIKTISDGNKSEDFLLSNMLATNHRNFYNENQPPVDNFSGIKYQMP
nr:NAC transcription factor 29-like [Ipomoea batatas]